VAKVLKKSVPGHWDKHRYGGDGCSSSYTECYELEKSDMETIEMGAEVMHFPVADGQAYYMVVKEQPLTLAWIPYGDAWQLPDAHLRGLNHRDLVNQREYDMRMKELFKGVSI